ncbi:uncharacterized protein METZ01_LOCUS179172, partial [marine metagenome]
VDVTGLIYFVAMSDIWDDEKGAGGAGGSSGKHCDACNEWLDSSDTHCPSCGSER